MVLEDDNSIEEAPEKIYMKIAKPQDNVNKEEAAIRDYYDANLDVLPRPSIEELEQLSQIAANTIKAKKINMRVRQNDLDALKKKAEQVGIGYQTILTLLIRQYVAGEIELKL